MIFLSSALSLSIAVAISFGIDTTLFVPFSKFFLLSLMASSLIRLYISRISTSFSFAVLTLAAAACFGSLHWLHRPCARSLVCGEGESGLRQPLPAWPAQWSNFVLYRYHFIIVFLHLLPSLFLFPLGSSPEFHLSCHSHHDVARRAKRRVV